MAKGQHLSAYQKKIVNRYYEHLDTITITKLAESTSELYLCTEPKKAEKLWQTVARALDKTAAGDKQVKRILETKDIKGLAELVGKLSK
jgi:hypothetical protein